ncbi:MAG TPA: autotransporter-associated beta strand repeat-containing protein [Verrucomicrobiae bacterium]|nr:autotransporter-associated beta strand repeat-containing protein [Verrucomicrobiae bacterium]
MKNVFRRSMKVCACVALGAAAAARAQQPAFPGALGFGANATGGRSAAVYHVTSLADSGSGTFRDAVSANNRIVVFDVGGYIQLASPVSVANDITIAGQTAPGGGIGIMGREVSFSGSTNIICRFVRFRQGDLDTDTGKSGINLGGTTNAIFDHISVEFGQWDNIDAVSCNNISIQNSIDADPVYQQFCSHTEQLGANFAWCYTIFASGHNRQPLAKINTIYVNNVVYNYELGYTVANTSGVFSHDIVNNYFITGPATTTPSDDFFQMNANQSIYSVGNLLDSNDDGSLNGSPTAPSGVTVLSSPWSPLTTNIPTFATPTAFRYDVSASGVQPPDQVDALVIGQVMSLGNGSTGTVAGTAGPGTSLYTSESQTGLGNGGYGVINGGPALVDTDGDGMPDIWEIAIGSNPNVPDGNVITPSGYTRFEDYLNWLAAPHAVLTVNSFTNIDLTQYTVGFTNDSPTYSVSNPSNGVVSLLADGHTAQFIPTTNFFGLAGFSFSVVGADGASMSNTFGVLVGTNATVQPPPSLIWRGDGVLNNWDVQSSTNWFNGATLSVFTNGTGVVFDDTGSDSPAINLIGALSPSSVAVTATQTYTFAGSGSLSGSMSLTDSGLGTLTLGITCSYNGGTVVSTGTLVGTTSSLQGSILNNGAMVFDQSADGTFTGSISGTGSLTKTNANTLTLKSGNSYTGKTFLNQGTVSISADSAFGANPATLTPDQLTFNGGTLRVTAGIVQGSNRGITLDSNGGTIEVLGSSSLTNTQIISGPGGLTKNGTGMLALGQTSSNHTYTSLVLNAGTISMDKSTGLGTGTVLINGGAISCYRNGTSRSPGNTVILNADVTLGSSGITSPMTFTGPWTITNGSHQIIVNTITNTINGPIGQDVPGRGLTKAGSGPLILGGTNTYSGPTTINVGTLALTNFGSIVDSATISVASGAVFDVTGVTGGPFTLATGQALAGNGLVKGSVTVGNGATLSPGGPAGALSFSNGLTVATTAELDFGLGTNGAKAVVRGNLTLGGTLNITDAGGFTNTAYTLFTYTGTLTYGGVTVGATPYGGLTYTISTDTIGQVNLVVAIAPPPPLDPFVAWQLQYFGCTNCANAQANADPLGKGISNTNQFLAGLNPTNPASQFQIISTAQNTTDVVIVWQAAGIRTNAVQATSGAVDGSYNTNGFADISGPIILGIAGDTSTNYTDAGGATNVPSRYYRIRLVP